MKCHLYVEDQIRHWPAENMVKRNCKHQWDVFMFDPDVHTYCCELTPSYCMEPVYGTFELTETAADENDVTSVFHEPHLMDDLDMRVSDSQRDQCMYMHVSTVDSLPKFETDEIPSELPASFVIIYDEEVEYEELEEFRDNLTGNPPV